MHQTSTINYTYCVQQMNEENANEDSKWIWYHYLTAPKRRSLNNLSSQSPVGNPNNHRLTRYERSRELKYSPEEKENASLSSCLRQRDCHGDCQQAS